MSLADLTRNCFQSGMSAAKWIGLCKLYASKRNYSGNEDLEAELSNSVLVLYRSYPGDPYLQDYLKRAIRDQMLSVSIFVATMLQAARSPELHDSATLDMLCRVALDAHYSSGSQPVGSVVSYSESPIVILGTIQDAFALLSIAYTLQMTHFHQLITSASELVVLLLACVTDMSQVSTAQALVSFAEANSMLHNFRLLPNIRQATESFVVSLSLLIGDDAKAAREAQMMHSIQIALGKGDVLGTNSDTDIISLGFLFHHLVCHRAGEFGAGSGLECVALLVATLRWTSWTPIVFYTQLVHSVLARLSQSTPSVSMLWRAFIVGRLPQILIMFEKAVQSDNSSDQDWRSAMQMALASTVRRSDILTQCDEVLSAAGALAHEFPYPSRSIFRDLLQQLLANDLVEQSFAAAIDPAISNDNTRFQTEAHDAGMDLESYFDAKLAPETNPKDTQTFLERVWRDAGSHAVFAEAVRKRFISLSTALDVEPLSYLCKVLYTYDNALDILSLHTPITELVSHALLFLDHYDCETVGDPQTAVSHLGDVVLFVQYVISLFQLNQRTYSLGDTSLSSEFLRTTANVQGVEELADADTAAFGTWFKALFDTSSEGIEDTILRSTHPKTLLRISATLFSHAIVASSERRIDVDVLTNGVSYFLGPLLNWTLIGVVQALLHEVYQKGFTAPTHLDILQMLLTSSSCPRPVLRICGSRVLTLLSNSKVANYAKLDAAALRQVVTRALPSAREANLSDTWQELPRRTVQEAFAMARAGKASSIDVERCLAVMNPTTFLQLLWLEAASPGELEAGRRTITFILTCPRPPTIPPLFPIFLHIVLPSLISTSDQQQPPEQTMTIELLVIVISSVLTAALHVERALLSVCGKHRCVLGQTSSSAARRLATDLRARKYSHTSGMILQRLTSSHSFVANFPVFIGELGM